jgi:lactate permease
MTCPVDDPIGLPAIWWGYAGCVSLATRPETRLSGVDATLGLAFAGAVVLYPFFGTLLGWLGVALAGSDTASNILFGNLQKITSELLGLSPILMGAANSSVSWAR